MSFKSHFSLLAPGLILLPAGVWLHLSPGSPWLAEAGRGYPYAALAVAALLAWRFRRSRVAAVAVALAMVHVLLGQAAGGGEGPGGLADHAELLEIGRGLAAASFAPLLALLALTPDRRLGAPRAILQVGAAPTLALVVAALLLLDERVGAAVTSLLRPALTDPAHTAWTGLPQGAVAGAAAGLALLAILTLYRRRAFDGALLWIAVGGTLALVAGWPGSGPGGGASAPGGLALPLGGATPALGGAGSAAPGIWVLASAVALCVAVMEASHALAYRDDLTDLPGRRALNDLLASLRAPATVAIVDIDHFKTFNDRHGHDVGDQVLRKVAKALAAVGGGGRAFRSGGEEFTIVFAGRDADEALPHLEALRRRIAGSDFTVRRAVRAPGARGAKKRRSTSGSGAGSTRARRGRGRGRRRLSVTVSIGAASLGGSIRSAEEAVTSADSAMYRAKKGGRNRVVA